MNTLPIELIYIIDNYTYQIKKNIVLDELKDYINNKRNIQYKNFNNNKVLTCFESAIRNDPDLLFPLFKITDKLNRSSVIKIY